MKFPISSIPPVNVPFTTYQGCIQLTSRLLYVLARSFRRAVTTYNDLWLKTKKKLVSESISSFPYLSALLMDKSGSFPYLNYSLYAEFNSNLFGFALVLITSGTYVKKCNHPFLTNSLSSSSSSFSSGFDTTKLVLSLEI